MNGVQDVYDFILAEGLAGGATGWALVRRNIEDHPGDQLVGVTEDGGSPPEMGSAAVREPGVQVRVRGAANDGDGVQAKAEAIFSALHGLANAVSVGGGTYLRVEAMTSGPVMFRDDKKRWNATTTYMLLGELV